MELDELYKIASEQNVKVMDFALPQNTAVTIELCDGCFVGVNPDVFTSKRAEKVVIAHELAHVVTGSLYSIDCNSIERLKKEAKAEKWTVEKLVPLEKLKMAVDDGYTDAYSLAEYFEVPEDFMVKALLYYRNKQ